ncbi:MAG TPA: hypothetical protein VD993_14630 [Chitinophagaceae bacterium]|nr:hypothetical protein [Chitinophagaceae bacterium]
MEQFQEPAAEQLPLSNEPVFVRAFAHAVSYIFHPLFIALYVIGFLLFIHPLAFAGMEHKLRVFRLLAVLVSTTLLPAFSVFLLWRLEFIRSIFLRTQKERIIPYAIAIIFYFWIWYVFKNLRDSPVAAKEFLLGVFLAVCGAWMTNIFAKVSMHSTAVGGMLTFLVLQAWIDPNVNGTIISIALLITGLVCTARLIVGHHSTKQVYGGLAIGALAQIVAVYFT